MSEAAYSLLSLSEGRPAKGSRVFSPSLTCEDVATLVARAYLRRLQAPRNRVSTVQLREPCGQVENPESPANPASPELTTAPKRASIVVPEDVPPPGEEARCTS
jgi:hypothetical protein